MLVQAMDGGVVKGSIRLGRVVDALVLRLIPLLRGHFKITAEMEYIFHRVRLLAGLSQKSQPDLLFQGGMRKMNHRKSLNVGVVLASLCLLGLPAARSADGAQSQSSTSAKHKAVLQVSEGDSRKWNLALNNARNLQEDVGRANVDIEIVTFGPGIAMVRFDSEVADRIAETVGRGIKIAVCENTMNAQKLTKNDMLPNLNYVKAGVTELMTKQEQGYAYIRP